MEVFIVEDDSEEDTNAFIDVDKLENDRASAKLSLLNETFPEADKEFLRTKSVEYAWDEIGFDLLLERMFLNDFPKRPVVMNPPTKENVKDKVRPNFNLVEFLKKYPDPVNHFSQNLTAMFYANHSLRVLLSRYRLIRADIVKLTLKRHKYRLYTADKELKGIKKNTRINPRLDYELESDLGKPPDEFLDEVDLIENEEEIETYFADKMLARNQAVEEARKTNALLICGCCMADDLLTEEVSNCSEGHIFCRKCILTSSNIRIGDGKTDFPCLQECTGGSFTLSTLEDILPPNTYTHLLKKIQEKEVAAANIPGLETCSFCSYSAIPPEDSRIFHCDNCSSQTCRLCHKKAHIPLKCSEVKDSDTSQRVFVEEKMSGALLRKCWKCGIQFLREDGCNKMVCVCGAKMCYICRNPIRGYDHFGNNENGQGNSGKCPLWTSNKEAHDKAVAREGRRAIEELKRKHPEGTIDLFPAKKGR